MHIYEVVALKNGIAFKGIESSVVVAKSPESAVKLIVDRCNVVAGSERYTMDDFEAGSPIEPENFAKETVIN
ncbi:MAG: hypothetical protein ACLRX6_03370 [Limosilactobacillus pontis]|uniref:hypothetical protein n=1 Tax=Limosilactobacillus pontis TaxID=35787 RepID=UPI00399F7D26